MGGIAIIDCQISGISGDMLLSSLVDAGANKKQIISAIRATQTYLKGSTIHKVNFVKKAVGGFNATQFVLEYYDKVHVRKGAEIYRSLSHCCENVGLGRRGKAFALETMKKIINAESIIHGKRFNYVHLHEASSIDTFADLIGCAIALEDLDLFRSKFYSTQIAVGSGQLKFSHGVVPNPGNAILEIFKGLPFVLVGNSMKEELTTPTGAAMLVTLCEKGVDYYPAICAEKSGYGTGQRSIKNSGNILRLLIGRSATLIDENTDTVVVVETNIDDLSGELMGNLIEEVDRSGALDVSIVQGLSKKNRPVYIMKIITEVKNLDNILERLYKESGTLGARVQEVNRVVLPRTIITTSMSIDGRQFNVRVKISRDFRGEIINVKPEFLDIKHISQETGSATMKVMNLVKAKIINQFGDI